MSAVIQTKRITVPEIRAHKNAKPVVCLTCYHAHTARWLDEHVDLMLVGDSVGMVMHGMENTLGVTLDMMIMHGKAVMRGSKRITSNSVTTVIDATKGQVNLVELYVIENAGSTPNLTVDIFDGTNSYPLPDTSKAVWIVKAVTANQAVEFSSRVIPKGSILRVTSSDAAGKFNIIGTKVSSGRTPIGGP